MSENNNSETVDDAAHGEDSGGHEAHPKPKYDDVNIPVVTLLGILSAILTFVSIAFVQGLYFNWQESMVQQDWNSRVMTPQEKTIVEQKQIRDGFYETKDGKVFVSVQVAAKKMIGNPSSSQSPKSGDDDNGASKVAEKKVLPEPPGPDLP